MEFGNGGTPSQNKTNRASAAESARKKVLAVYSSALRSLKKTSSDSSDYVAPPIPGGIYSTPELSGDADRHDTNSTDSDNLNPPLNANQNDLSFSITQAPANEPQSQYQSDFQSSLVTPSLSYDTDDETSALKDVPINQTNVDQEWQQYHTAWQNYYQKYYSDYYSKAAQSYLETEKLKNERAASGELHRKRKLKRLAPILIFGAIVLTVLFLQYNRLIFAPIMAYVVPDTADVATSIEAVDPSITQNVSADPRLIIPKLNVDVPVAFNIHYNDVFEAMNHGVAQFMIPGADALPGQIGNLVISGHSAGDIYSDNPYKFIFSGLERLQVGDLIYINYESVRYTYRMTESKIVEPTDVQSLIYSTEKPILTLITCTPLGTSRYRLLVIAEQISPDYSGDASTPPEDPAEEDQEYSMPANEPSIFERIFGN